MYLRRSIDTVLSEWRDQPNRRPLIVRGARQVGKSETIRSFGQRTFTRTVEINFELQPHLKGAFTTLEPKVILQQISLALGTPIEGGTLLFLDEVQECSNVILALRYFFEKTPEIHVIAAGSLLEFALEEDSSRMPVGRVQYLYMHPMSFLEFLDNLGHTVLLDALRNMSVKMPIGESGHDHLLKLFRSYLAVGGFPAVVKQYLTDPISLHSQHLQDSIIQTYRDDFRKYRTRIHPDVLERVYTASFAMVAELYKYSRIDREIQARSLKHALSLLIKAQVFHKVVASKAAGLPLAAQTKESFFKIICVDVGILLRRLGLTLKVVQDDNLQFINSGAIAEQVVGQELLAYQDCFEEPRLFFWLRDKSGSAEVDYVTSLERNILPIEVKSGTAGRLRSLQLFLQERGSPLGVKISSRPLARDKKILSLPLYAISQLTRLVEQESVSV